MVVEVFTDKGLVGIGELMFFGGPELVRKYVAQEIPPRRTGKNPFDVEHFTAPWFGASFDSRP